MEITPCTICNFNTANGSLCNRCHAKIHSQLDDLIEFWVGAHDELLPGKSGNGGRSSERTIGLNVAALSFIAGHDILAFLHGWESIIREDRGLTPPALVAKPNSLEAEIRDAIGFAQSHLAWSGSQEWISDFTKELRQIHGQGMAAARQFVEKTRKIPCPAETGEGACSQLLTINADDPLEIFECRRCKSQWTTLRLIAVAMSSKQSVWLDAEAISNYLRMTVKNFQQYAKRNSIPRRGELYEMKSVMAIRKATT